jgi:hypothetical protein
MKKIFTMKIAIAFAFILFNAKTYAQADSTPQVVSIAKLDYNWKTGEGSGLSGITMYLNNLGICGDKEAKSGWINIDTWGFYNDANGKENKVLLKKVCFWVNSGGNNWWVFSVDKALLMGLAEKPLIFSTKIEKLSEDKNRPIILIEGKYKLIPVVTSLDNIVFKQKPVVKNK